MHPTSADWRAATDCIGVCQEARNIDELLSTLCARLRQVFQADLVMWTTYAPDMTATGYQMSPAIDVAHLFAPFVHFFPEHPWFSCMSEIVSKGHTPLLSDYISLRSLLRTGLWNEVYVHLYSKHQLGVGGRMGAQGFFTFGINRLGRDYGARERELMRYMRPQIETTIQRAARAEQARHLASALQQFFTHGDNAYAWISADGALREISVEARRLLGTAAAGLHEGAPVPPTILAAVRRLHAPGKRPRKFIGVRLGTLEGVLLSLGAGEGAILLLDPIPQPPIPGKSALTRRETEVLHWLGEGKSNGEIGILCGISARTVSRHCENLFAKLGVESRYAAALLARDYRNEG